MRRVTLPALNATISRQLSLRTPHGRRSTDADAQWRYAVSNTEAQRWAQLLVDQYGAEAEELAEIGVIEMLALKKTAYLVLWSKIYAAIREIQGREPG